MNRDLYALFGAESLQLDEQSEATGWSMIWMIAFGCFAAGALVTAGLAWMISWFL